MFDLHTHTTRSDGRTRPSQNVRLAADAGLAGLALTDHDTTEGWDEAAAACAGLAVAFVPGIELSTEQGGRSVHMLGYFVDAGDAALQAECARLRGERAARAARMLDLLAGHGIDIEFAMVRAIAGDAPVGRPHVAEALVRAGAVADTREAFDRWIAEGQPAYAGKHAITPEDGVALIRGAGGAAVLAHPGLERGERDRNDPLAAPGAGLGFDLLDRLAAAGLSGVEADHAGHDDAARATWRAAAVARDLLVTGSSDFHGRHEDERIGAATTPTRVVDALRERAGDGVAGALATEGSKPW